MSDINNILCIDTLSEIFLRLDTLFDWKNSCLVCRLWKNASDLAASDFANKFVKFEETLNEKVYQNNLYKKYNSYYYLPNLRLHGKWSSIEFIINIDSNKVVALREVVINFKFGTLLDSKIKDHDISIEDE